MNHADLVRDIENGIAGLGEAVPSAASETLASLLVELEKWTHRMNLTAIRKLPDMVPGHITDSLSVLPYLEGERAIDIGTGAGFPGLPLAIARPDMAFVLLDSSAKKMRFVRHIVASLGLANVTPVRSRAEDYAPGRGFDTVLARAVTRTAGLLDYGAHLVGEGGVFLAMKGKYPSEELENVPDDWTYTVKELLVPGLEDRERHLVSLRRKAAP